jgi:hypothetical protein
MTVHLPLPPPSSSPSVNQLSCLLRSSFNEALMAQDSERTGPSKESEVPPPTIASHLSLLPFKPAFLFPSTINEYPTDDTTHGTTQNSLRLRPPILSIHLDPISRHCSSALRPFCSTIQLAKFTTRTTPNDNRRSKPRWMIVLRSRRSMQRQ